MKRFLGLLMLAAIAAVAFAGPLEKKTPTATITASAETIKAGESATLTWSTTNAKKAVLATVTEAGETATEAVELSGAKTVTPTVSTGYRLYASRGFKRTYAQVAVDVEGTTPDPTPEPTPEPTPTPTAGSKLSAIGIGSAFSVSSTLAQAAADHDLRVYVESQAGTWAVIDPLMLDGKHPAAFDAWLKVFIDSGKKQPAVIWYQKADGKTKVLAIDGVTDTTTGADLLTLAKSHVAQPADGTVVIGGKTRALGLKLAKRGAPVARRVSEILTPLAAKDYPKSVDLRGQFVYRKDQGPHGTCVSQAFSEAGEAACFRAFGSINTVELSPNFLATRIDGWNGAWAADAAAAIQKDGIVEMAEQPNYSSRLPSGWQAKAAEHRALGVYGPPEKNSVGYVAAAIARGLPVCVGIAVGNGFDPDGEGYITYARGAGGQVNHEVLIVGGWFEHDGKKFVLMKNSWGASWGTWGDGCCYIEDRFLADDTDMWVVVVMSAAADYKFDAAPDAQPVPKAPPRHSIDKIMEAIVEPSSAPRAPAVCPACQGGGFRFRRR